MDQSQALATSGMLAAMGVYLVVCIAIGVLSVVSLWILFSKAGKPGWASIVPIYSAIVMLNIGGKPWYWILLMCIPVVNIVISIMAIQAFLKAYGKGDVGSVLLALFFSFIYFPYLAFSKNVNYVGV